MTIQVGDIPIEHLAKWRGHSAFRIVASRRWPPDTMPCFAAWLIHRDGTEVLYLRGTARCSDGEQLSDAQAIEAFGEGNCHRCVFCFGYGRVYPDGEYHSHFGTTQKLGHENPWGTLCQRCRRELAIEAVTAMSKRLKALGFHPTSTVVEEMIRLFENLREKGKA